MKLYKRLQSTYDMYEEIFVKNRWNNLNNFSNIFIDFKHR